MDALVVPDLALPAKHLKEFLKTIARIAFGRLSQPLDHRFITPRIRLIVKRSPAQQAYPAGMAYAHRKLRGQIAYELTLYRWF